MTHYLNGFTPDVECKTCNGNGWLPRRWGFNSRVQLTEEDCPECLGHGWRPMTQDEIDDAAADAFAAKDAEIARLRAIIASQIQWTPGEPPKEDGAVVYGVTWQPYRWKAYSPKSEQFRRGIKGRWQAMGEYGGWNNAPAPNEWATEEAVIARAALNGEAGNG